MKSCLSVVASSSGSSFLGRDRLVETFRVFRSVLNPEKFSRLLLSLASSENTARSFPPLFLGLVRYLFSSMWGYSNTIVISFVWIVFYWYFYNAVRSLIAGTLVKSDRFSFWLWGGSSVLNEFYVAFFIPVIVVVVNSLLCIWGSLSALEVWEETPAY